MFLSFSNIQFLKGIDMFLYEKYISFTSKNNQSRTIFKDVKNIIGNGPVSIIDAGSNDGLYSLLFRMYFPNSTIYAFEPNPEVKLIKQIKNDERVKVFHVALGDKNEQQKMYVYEDTSLSKSSSISKPIMEDRKMKTIDITVTTLDTWMRKESINNIDILKLDLEGYDLKALRGSTSLFPKIKVIIIEVLFHKRYEETSTFFDINEFLSKNGFEFFNLYDIGIDINGRLNVGNAVFIKKNMAKQE